MVEITVIIFLLLLVYLIAKTFISSSIRTSKWELKRQKNYIKFRIKNIKYEGPISDAEKNKYKDTIHGIIISALNKQSKISLFQKYIGIPDTAPERLKAGSVQQLRQAVHPESIRSAMKV